MFLLEKRKTRVLGFDEALDLVSDGTTLGIGGFINSNQPMAFVRALIKKGVNDLTVVGPSSAGIATDMLIGAGSVKKVVAPYVGAEEIFPIGPNFRRAVENSEIEVWECGEGIFYASLYAHIWDLPAVLWKGGIGTSIPDLNPDVKRIEFEGEQVLSVKPTKIDVFVGHVPVSDKFGNVAYQGVSWGDLVTAKSSRHVIYTAEKLADDFKTDYTADYVVEAPCGAHPTACSACYMEDERALNEYLKAASSLKEDPRSFKKYLEKMVMPHLDYVRKYQARCKELAYEG